MHFIRVEDTGVGVDLRSAHDLFKPFVRKLHLSQERKALGLGGTGLGLSIVRMIAGNVGCRVNFVAPTAGFKTAFELSWSE
jgi:signal transduction histidine kinase